MASISGKVKEDGVAVSRPLYCYDRSTGQQVAAATSDAFGNYAFTGLDATKQYYVVCLDDNQGNIFNAQVYDRITPV